MLLRVAICRLPHAEDLPMPAYASEGAAGMDLLAAVENSVVLGSGEWQAIPCGIAIALPVGYEAQIRPRSGLALKHGISCLNSPGTIDSDYRGEIKAILINHGTENFTITRAMRIAQIIVAAHSRVAWEETDTLPDSVRQGGGFGSTGI